MKFSSQHIASYQIPIFTYIFTDDEMMTHKIFPSLFSMIDSEEDEGKIIINFLKRMDYRYMDIWYHKFSKEMAHYIWDNYVQKVENGCGRIAEVTNTLDFYKIKEKYKQSGGISSQVQLILSNSKTTTTSMLKHMTGELGFHNKIYILGISNGRKSFLKHYTTVINNDESQNNTLVLPLAPLLNMELPQMQTKLKAKWQPKQDKLDLIYRGIQRNIGCIESPGHCFHETTSWLPYVIGGIKVITNSLHEILLNSDGPVCINDMRNRIFNIIKDNSRKFPVNFESNVSYDMLFKDRALHLGYDIGVYQSRMDNFDVIGKAHSESLSLNGTNKTILENISIYNKTCSEDCTPGFFKYYDKRETLPFCWTCLPCAKNTITTETNAGQCEPCGVENCSTISNTCTKVSELYISVTSRYFLVGAVTAGVSIMTTIILGIIVKRNEIRPIVKACDKEYLYLMLFSLTLGFATSVIPLLKPTSFSCSAEYLSQILVSSLITTNLAWRSIMVYRIFTADRVLKRKSFATIKILFLNIVILVTVFSFGLIDVLVVGPTWYIDKTEERDHEPMYLICKSHGVGATGLFAFLPLVPAIAAFGVTLILAFKMRQFPFNFKETLNIFAAAMICLSCYLMYFAGYSFSKDYYKSLLRTILYLASNLAFLFCIFLPKTIVLLKPDVDIEMERAEVRYSINTFAAAPPNLGRKSIQRSATSG